MRQITQTELQKLIHAALRAYNSLAGTPENFLSNLLLVQIEIDKNSPRSATAKRLATNHVLNKAIETLRLRDPEGSKIIQLRFVEGEIASRVKYMMKLSEDQVKRRQRAAIKSLAQIIWERETAVRTQQAHALKAQLLPPTYTQLFGLAGKRRLISEQLLKSTDSWIFSISGIGGIGKTALADMVIRDVIEDFAFEQVMWLRADNSGGKKSPENIWNDLVLQLAEKCQLDRSILTAFTQTVQQIKNLLTIMPSLIVIDNLETEIETAHIAEQLQSFTNPSKFLLTTRARLSGAIGIWTISLEELSKQDTIALIRHHSHNIGLTELATANERALTPILEKVGGNPLALKLIIGLATVLSLPHILDNLISVNHEAIVTMYKYIYWQSWSTLSENGRILLEMMPMAAEVGMSPEQMIAITTLNEQALWITITELTNRSLLEVRGTAWERRYGIHNLTKTFLQTEIINWPEEEK